MTINCEYTDPIVLDLTGSEIVPIDNTLPFQYSKSTCEASVSAQIDYSPYFEDILNFYSISYTAILFVAFFIGFYLITTLFRRGT